ncbi:MAG: CBS domain-containing protein [Candidatus Zixiibacteriota bacterium]
MRVSTLLESKPREVITVSSSTSVDDAMDKLISNNIGCLPVVDDEGNLIGIVSDKDIFAKIHETKGDYHNLTVNDVMEKAVIVGLLSDDISYIASIMDKNWIRHVPIVEEDSLVGLVSLRDILKANTQTTAIENRYLRQHLDGMHSRDRSADV